MRPNRIPEPERFARHVDRSGVCWEWTAARDDDGYGLFQRDDRRQRFAHRVAWELANGPIPAGLWVLHTCDNPPCVNPAHLWLGTHADNTADKLSKGRQPTGAAHGRARLTEAAVRDIRARHAAGESQKVMAAEYGVTDGAINHVVSRRNWRSLP